MKLKLKLERKGKQVFQVTNAVIDRVANAVAATAKSFEAAAKRRCPVSGTVKAGWVMVKSRTKLGRATGAFAFKKVRLPEASARIPGRLRASIISRSWRRGYKYFGSCGFTVDYGIFVEFGTSGPSAAIRPKNKKALAWYGPDREIFIRKHSRGGPIKVGTPTAPREASTNPWEAAKERGARRQSMPFLRPAWYIETLPVARKRFGRALNPKKKTS